MLAKDNMSVKAETIKIGGFGVPPTYITEAFSLREEFKLVDHWKRRHIFHVVYPNEPAASVFEKKLNAEEIVKETISSAGLLKGAKLITKAGNYRMFGKTGGFVRAEAEFSLLRAKNIVKSGNKIYGQLEDTTVVLVKERRGAMINIWKNKKRKQTKKWPNAFIEIQKIDRIEYCCEKKT